MPSSFSSLDTGFPNLNKYGSTEQKLQAIESYLVQLLEQLRYTLNNLSQDNFNTKEVTGWLGQVVTEPIRVAIENVEEEIQTQIDVSAEGVKSTVAKGLKQYDTSGVTGGVDYYGYGDPTVPAAGNNGKKYLDQNTGYYWTCNGSTWTKSTNALPLITDKKQDSATLITTINQSASKIQTSAIKYDNNDGHLLSSWMNQTAEDISARVTNEEMESAIEASAGDIMLTVTGAAAPEWVASHSYAKDDVVKVTTAATSSTAQSIAYYKAKSNHTSSAGNKPPNATYWTSTSAPNVQSMIDLNLNGLTLAYDNGNIGADEHNGSYIKLMKDGTFIGGGKVFIKDLDAGTITTGQLSADYIMGGTLDAGAINMNGSFTVKAIDAYDWASDKSYTTSDYVRKTVQISESAQRVYYYNCILAHTSSASNAPPNSTYWTQVSKSSLPGIGVGTIGGNYVNSTGDSSIELLSANGDNDVFISDECSAMDSTVGTGIRTVKVNENMIELVAAESSSNRVRVWIEKDDITLRRTVNGTTTTYHLFDLLDQI